MVSINVSAVPSGSTSLRGLTDDRASGSRSPFGRKDRGSMKIRLGYDISFSIPTSVPMTLALNVYPSRIPTLLEPENLTIEPNVPHSQFTDPFGNTITRLVAPPGIVRFKNDFTVTDSGEIDERDPYAQQHPIDKLPPEVMQFLLASRYCEVDLLQNDAWRLFGRLQGTGMQLAEAICTWVNQHITFGYPHARNTRTAAEGFRERIGVCRDFTHLAVALTRCMNIPARYVTGYLGDIGVPYSPSPMDFSAWYEVYLGGRWWTFDARHNQRRIGRVLMAVGRDAVDVALTTAFGSAPLNSFFVITDEIKA